MKTQKLPEHPSVTVAADPALNAPTLLSNPARVARQPRVGLTLSGRYRLDHRLGVGGMGEVYKGLHLSLDVPIAIKLMHEDIANAPSYAQRFQREAQSASRLHHRNVVRVLDFGEDHGLWYLVMEYLEGESLAQIVARGLPLLDVVRASMTDVFSALGAAHALGVVHRDLKPENVLAAQESDGRVVYKIVDFGLARMEPKAGEERLTQPESVAGTPEYMSPEQCESLDVGPATDLYAAGCVLTSLLQGRPPFDARSPVEIMARHMFLPAPPLARPADQPPVPPALEALRLDLLQKRPADRPESAAACLARLDAAFEAGAATGRSEAHAVTREERAPAWERPEARRPGASPPVIVRWVGEPPPGDVLTGLAVADLPLERRGAGDAKLRVVSAPSVERALAALGADPLPCVVVAPISDAGDVQRLIEAGAADVVPAPPAVELLTKKLRRLARR